MGAESKLGTVLSAGDVDRDAVHVAVIPVIAGTDVHSGMHVGIYYENESSRGNIPVVSPFAKKFIGIIDPFLERMVVRAGERVFLWIYPGSVTGMRHHWSHPEFQGDSLEKSVDLDVKGCDKPQGVVINEPLVSQEVLKAEVWLRAQCEPLGVSFDELVSPDSDLVRGEYILNSRNEDARDHWYGIEEEFWKQHAIFTGKVTPERMRGGFSCSC